jgi:hypothetical protein
MATSAVVDWRRVRQRVRSEAKPTIDAALPSDCRPPNLFERRSEQKWLGIISMCMRATIVFFPITLAWNFRDRCLPAGTVRVIREVLKQEEWLTAAEKEAHEFRVVDQLGDTVAVVPFGERDGY